MGDLVELTTVPNQVKIFYKVTSGSLRFQVKGSSSAGIGLTKNPMEGCEVEFILGRRGITTIKKKNVQVQALRTPHISVLSPQEYKEFWIQWHDDIICLGENDLADPFVIYNYTTSYLNYISFYVAVDDEYTLHWKFEMPPIYEQFKVRPIRDGTLQWVPADGQLPVGSFIGGHEKEILYIIRAKHQGSLTPGKFLPSHGLGYISWGGLSHEKDEIEVLCGYDCMWVSSSNGRIPVGSVQGGYTEGSDHEPLFVGRAYYNNHLVPGKIQPSHKVCYIPYRNKEIGISHYEVLVVPRENAISMNSFLVYEHMALN